MIDLVPALVIATDVAPSPIMIFIGRLHPLMVHFPIGLVIAATFFECVGVLTKQKRFRLTVAACLAVGFIGSVVAAACGWIAADLEPHTGQMEGLMNLHRWLSIGSVAATGLALLGVFNRHDDRKKWATWTARIGMIIATGLLGVGGHFGAELVHGKGYLFGVFFDDLYVDPGIELDIPRPDDSGRTISYRLDIQPILETHCYQCHGQTRRKGHLRLHTEAAAFGGPREHWSIIPGDAEGSLLYQRIILPDGDFDLMPPEDGPLSKEQINLIRIWIDEGAYWKEPRPFTE